LEFFVTAVEPSPDQPTAEKRTILLIEPASGWGSLNLAEIWHYRELMLEMARRNIRIRYKQTAIGIVWVVLQPLLGAGIFSLIFGEFAQLPSDGVPYILFSFLGLVAWGFFSKSVNSGAGSLVGQAGLVRKIYFPRIIAPISSILSTIVDLLVSLLLAFVMLAIFSIPLTWNLVFLPFFLFLIAFNALGIGIWLATLGVYYRDFIYVTAYLLQIWMFATPVAYSASLVTERWYGLYILNPMVAPVEGLRWVFLGESYLNASMIVSSLVVATIILISGMLFLNRVERTMIDVI
jgi:lipopolysaccharide transport system permease protein